MTTHHIPTPEPDITLPSSGITTRITLLSLLSLRPMHGYELRQVMEQRHMHRWADIRYGSIYRGLQQMAREGLLAEDGEERAGNRPPRTIYRITEEGTAELRRLLHQAWAEPARFADPIDLAMILFHHLPPDEIRELLQTRLHALQAVTLKIGKIYADIHAHTQHLPPAVHTMSMDMFEYRKLQLQLEIDRTQHLLTQLNNGAYHLSEDDKAALHHMTQRRLRLDAQGEKGKKDKDAECAPDDHNHIT